MPIERSLILRRWQNELVLPDYILKDERKWIKIDLWAFWCCKLAQSLKIALYLHQLQFTSTIEREKEEKKTTHTRTLFEHSLNNTERTRTVKLYDRFIIQCGLNLNWALSKKKNYKENLNEQWKLAIKIGRCKNKNLHCLICRYSIANQCISACSRQPRRFADQIQTEYYRWSHIVSVRLTSHHFISNGFPLCD